jgi:ribosomal protein L11 methyltransferase
VSGQVPSDDPYHQFRITLPLSFRQIFIDRLIELGSLGIIEEDDQITAFFERKTDAQRILSELEVLLSLVRAADKASSVALDHALLANADWNIRWKENFQPLPVGTRFLIVPPWSAPYGSRIPIIIDPGMAFGTGHHETTRSCLVLMEHFICRVERERFLDLGTGTGLLAVAAHKLGFRHIDAIDNDPQAIEAAARNIALNQIPDISLRLSDSSAIAGNYNMIVANLVSEVLVTIAKDIADHVKENGIAILSGILKGQEAEVEAAFRVCGLLELERVMAGTWISLAVGH